MRKRRDPLKVKTLPFQSGERRKYSDPLGVAPQSFFQKLKNKLRQPKRGRGKKDK